MFNETIQNGFGVALVLLLLAAGLTLLTFALAAALWLSSLRKTLVWHTSTTTATASTSGPTPYTIVAAAAKEDEGDTAPIQCYCGHCARPIYTDPELALAVEEKTYLMYRCIGPKCQQVTLLDDASRAAS